MRLQIGSVSFTGEQIRSPRLNTSNVLGLTDLNVSIEIAYGTALPSLPALVGLVLSEDTGTPVKVFTGWAEEYEIDPIDNDESVVYTPKILSVLTYINDGKPISNYLLGGGSNTLLGHAEDLAIDAERLIIGANSKYFQISVSPSDTEPFFYSLENQIKPLLEVLSKLAADRKYDLIVQEAGWLDIPTLYAANGTITNLIFKEKGTNQNPAPSPLNDLIYDPTSPNHCDFPLLNFKWGKRKKRTTTVETQGVGAENAKEVGETVQTSYLRSIIKPIPNPVENEGLAPIEYSVELPIGAIKVHQFLFVSAAGDTIAQLELVEPYDPQTPLATGKFYFDRAARRVIPNNIDVNALDFALKPAFAVTVTFAFIKVRQTDTSASNRLNTATNGAITKSYVVVNDQGISDFGIAQTVTQNTLEAETVEEFYCSGEFHSTTVIPRNGETFRIRIPGYGEDHIVTINSVGTEFPGKTEESNQLRDEMVHQLTASAIVNNSLFGASSRSAGAAGTTGVGSGFAGEGNSSLPTYDEIPFDGGGATACSTITVITGENYTESNDLFDPQFNLPTTSTEAVTLAHTANIWNVKQSANFSFYLDGSIDTTEGNLTVTWNGTEIYNQDLDASFLATTTVIPLTEYQGASGELIASLTLVAQPTTNTGYQAFIEADCCAIDTIIGSGVQGFNTDGNIPLATDLYGPTKIKIYNGEIIFADADNFRVRKLDNTTNTIVTIGGNGDPVSGANAGNDIDATTTPFGEIPDMDLVGDKLYVLLQDYASEVGYIDLTNGKYYNVFTAADFNAHFGYYLECNGLVVDPADDTIYFSGIGTAAAHSVIYKYDGAFSIYAGTDGSGNNGFSGDGGAATSAKLDSPWGIELDGAGNLYMADTGNGRIRKVTKTTGIITTVAGGGASYTFESDALDFNFDTDRLYTLEIDSTTGDIYFVDSAGFIGKLKISDNKIYRIAGAGYYEDFLGDTGSPLTAFFETFGVFAGHIHFVSPTEIYIADSGNNRIRQIYCGLNPNCPNLYSMIADGDQSVAATNLDGTPDPVVSAAFDTTFVNGQQVRYFEAGASEFYMFDLGGYCEFDLDLTDPKFVGHTVGLKILRFFSIVFNVEANSVDWEAITKINGTTVDTFTDSFINPPATSGGESTTTSDNIDLSSYIGTTITVRIDFTSVLPDRGTPDIATHTNRFTLLLSC